MMSFDAETHFNAVTIKLVLIILLGCLRHPALGVVRIGGTVVEDVFKGEREAGPARIRDVEVARRRVVIGAHKHLVLRRVRYVVILHARWQRV